MISPIYFIVGPTAIGKSSLAIKVAKKFNGQLDYWYDGVHTSALGSKAIAEVIIDDLVEIIKKNETN